MLPRRHILDVWEFEKDREQFLSMATVSLAVDAIKYLDNIPRKDHLIDALELNEFVCYMFPGKRPENRSLLFHVVSDLLGLLMYGVPKKKRIAVENLETINYSERDMDVAPIIGVWHMLKANVYAKKHGPKSIVEGFVKKIRVEMAVMERYRFVEDVFYQSMERLNEWLPSLARYYDRSPGTVQSVYEKWWALWRCREEKEKVLTGMIERLSVQAERELHINIDKGSLFNTVFSDREGNDRENEAFSKWYRVGVNFLLSI